jgi:hypothetical protein
MTDGFFACAKRVNNLSRKAVQVQRLGGTARAERTEAFQTQAAIKGAAFGPPRFAHELTFLSAALAHLPLLQYMPVPHLPGPLPRPLAEALLPLLLFFDVFAAFFVFLTSSKVDGALRPSAGEAVGAANAPKVDVTKNIAATTGEMIRMALFPS